MLGKRAVSLSVAAFAVTALAVSSIIALPAGAELIQQGSPLEPLTAATAAALAQNVNTPVIVLMRDQPAAAQKDGGAAKTRSSAISNDQATLVSELSEVHATKVRRFTVINAIAATVSPGEAARLTANPTVAEVVPDSVLRAAPIPGSTGTNKSAPSAASSVPAGTCAAPGSTQLEPEGLADMHVDATDPTAKTARSLGYTGAGVKVGYFADGVDINNPDFIRADGSHVFADYQDFSGEGRNAPAPAGEGYLDSSSIAAQGRQTYNVQNFGAVPLPTACDIRIEGTAPGSSLYGYKTLGSNDISDLSNVVQAIDYAVNVDHVDVLNESVVFQPYPDDTTALNVLDQVNDAAVQAGVTVLAASGDTGGLNSEATPAANSQVIAVGASTDLRFLEQTNYSGARQFSTGWLNDNVSALSASGVTEAGGTIDLLAPGDSSFGLCTADATLYPACTSFAGSPSPVERSAGTSQAAPLASGVAALVVQAYWQAHNDANPTPALVKEILTSTADDLTEPGAEQGAGLVDAYRAVQAAASVHDATGSPTAVGSSLLVSQSQLNGIGAPGSSQRWTENITNTGASSQVVKLSGRTFGAAQNVQTRSVTLSDSASPHFTDWVGAASNYETTTFTVPAGTDRLDSALAYQVPANAGFNARVRLDLIDPDGRLASTSFSQGPSNFGSADVRFPTAGTWTAAIFSQESTTGGTTGVVKLQVDTANTMSFGSVSPATLTLAPGTSGSVTVTVPTGATPGDTSAALVVNGSGGQQSSVPIILRSLVEPTTGGAFAGTLLGSNGWTVGVGQQEFYQFDVPSGEKDLDAGIKLTNDAADTLDAFLVDPTGQSQALGANQLATAYNPTTRSGSFTPETGTDLYVRAPKAGRWTLIIKVTMTVGDEISQPFTGSISFNKVSVAGSAASVKLANTQLKPNSTVGVAIPVTNTGTAPEDFFIDPRLTTTSTLNLAAVIPATNVSLPLTFSQQQPAWLVPTDTSQLTITGTSTVPTNFDFAPETGDPDLLSSTGTTQTGSISGDPVAPGVWAAAPEEIGPFSSGAAPAATTSLRATVNTAGFDSNVSMAATDLWESAINPVTSMNLVTIQPGQTVTLNASITPTGAPGTTVQGAFHVDMLVVGNSASLQGLNYNDFADTEPSADELATVAYNYVVS